MNSKINEDKNFNHQYKDTWETLTDEKGNKYGSKIEDVKYSIQKIKKEIKNNGDVDTTFVANILADTQISTTPNSVKSFGGGGTPETWKWDNSGYNAKIWLRVEYVSTYSERNNIYYNLHKIKKISGKFSNVAIGIVPREIKLTEYTNGDKYSDAYGYNWVSRGKYTYSSTVYNNLYTYQNIAKIEGLYTNVTDLTTSTRIQANARGRISHGGSSWYTPTLEWLID